ncbi:MAG: nucleotidyltransferase domain-containing protein [Bacteroidetes bacterium]|nr:nucleotidyltransferase domain-containing protein [Bacteroidota bacterium]MCL5027996.1 nucleotidyltransferase domain-containing protein [Bacteroidota bacterium]
MNINYKLTVFAQQELVISHGDTEKLRIRISIEQLKKKLKDNLGADIKDILLFGSFTRNTILPRKYDPNSDIDLMVIFNTSNGIKTPETYRKNLLDIVSVAYPNSISKKDFPVVKLELNHIMFDIVPAYTQENIFVWRRSYNIPDSSNGWRSTVPNDINGNLSSTNQSYGNNIFLNTIRLCKHWNASTGYPFESYLMEKQIIDNGYFIKEDLYKRFLVTLNDIAGGDAGVRQALDYIEKYKGDWFNDPNEEKQLQWLQKLLPGLK